MKKKSQDYIYLSQLNPIDYVMKTINSGSYRIRKETNTKSRSTHVASGDGDGWVQWQPPQSSSHFMPQRNVDPKLQEKL